MATVTADGQAEDLIRSFQQLTCAEGHYKTLIEKYNSELVNGLIDLADDHVRRTHVEKMNDMVEELIQVSELRRGVMRRLLTMYNADKDLWCTVKHLANAEYTLFEAWQASDNDGELMNLYLEANARFVSAMSRFLGFTPTPCMACFSDILRNGGDALEMLDEFMTEGEKTDEST